MSNKHFTLKTKIKYIKLIEKFGLDEALIHFICEFEERYRIYEKFTGRKKTYRLPTKKGKQRLKIGQEKYYNGGMKALISKAGKAKKPGNGRPPKTKISDLTEHDQDLYQEIMEELLKERRVKPSEIMEKLKRRKEQNKKPDSVKDFCSVAKINRTYYYKKTVKKYKVIKNKVQRLGVPHLIEEMCMLIIASDGSLGRDKLYNSLYSAGFRVSSYIFRVHFEAMEYKSRAYIRKGNTTPREEKYAGQGCDDYVDGNFTSSYPGEVLHADIKYLYFENAGGYLHVITETYANKVLAGSLSKTRTATSTIELLSNTLSKLEFPPRIFHSDHGVEYANYKLKHFLETKGILQSMSRKGHSLGNRPSEYFFSLIQREKLSFYNIEGGSYNQVYTLVSNYMDWYHLGRVQSNLIYKTPHSVFTEYGFRV